MIAATYLVLAICLLAGLFIIWDNWRPAPCYGVENDETGEWETFSGFEFAELRRCKGGGAPKRDKKNEKLQRDLLKAQLAQAKRKVEVPEIEVPPPPPPPPPPPQATSADRVDAERDARQKALKRTNATRGTIFAGETGGLGGKKTILG